MHTFFTFYISVTHLKRIFLILFIHIYPYVAIAMSIRKLNCIKTSSMSHTFLNIHITFQVYVMWK